MTTTASSQTLIILRPAIWIIAKLKAWWRSSLLALWEKMGNYVSSLDGVDQTEVPAVDTTVAHLSFHTVSREMPYVLAVARYSDLDSPEQSVVEDRYSNEEGEHERLEAEVVDALYMGVDVAVLSQSSQ